MLRIIVAALSISLLATACSSDDRDSDGRVVVREPRETPDVGPDVDPDADHDAETHSDASEPDAAEDVTECIPESDQELCARSAYACGTLEATDNCGVLRTVDPCGLCEGLEECTEGICNCVPESEEELCTLAGAECDELEVEDRCGGTQTITCGTCEGDDVCGAGGIANMCGCEPESDEAMCARLNAECGVLDAVDNCGVQRVVASCGEEADVCTGFDTCGGGGTNGQCGCTPMTCDDLGVLCGTAEDGCGNILNCDEFCVDEIAAGQNHNCAIGSGKLKCWGRGGDGALGTGNTTTQRNPADVVGLTDVAHVAAGGHHTCAVTTAQALVCWGRNDRSQLGLGNTVDSNQPGAPTIGAGVDQVALGQQHTCARSGDKLECWGSNQHGQIGDSAFAIDTNVGIPTVPTGLDTGVRDVAAGAYHTCVIQDDAPQVGVVKCWGRNHTAQAGRFPAETRVGGNFWGWLQAAQWEPSSRLREPVTVTNASGTPFTNVKAIAAGDQHTCLISATDELYCWGTMPGLPRAECAFPDLATQPTNCASFPTSGIAIGQYRVQDDNPVVSNIHTMWIAEVPTLVSTGGKTPVGLGAGGNHHCVHVSDPDPDESNVYCWGNGAFGQIGDGTTNHWSAPRRVIEDTNAEDVAASQVALGGSHSCALVEGNNIRCWGSNADGQIGNSALQRDESYRAYPVLLE